MHDFISYWLISASVRNTCCIPLEAVAVTHSALAPLHWLHSSPSYSYPPMNRRLPPAGRSDWLTPPANQYVSGGPARQRPPDMQAAWEGGRKGCWELAQRVLGAVLLPRPVKGKALQEVCAGPVPPLHFLS